MSERRDFYVYAIYRPNGEPCYIGKGRGDRVLRHSKKSHNPQLAGIIKAAGGHLVAEKVAEALSNADALEYEIYLIAAIGRGDMGLGPLVNHTDGGESFTPSLAVRSRISATLKGRKLHRLMEKGVSKSPEQRARQSLSHKGIPLSRDHAMAIGAAHLGKKRSPETRARMSKAARKGCAHGESDVRYEIGKRGYPTRRCRSCKRERERAKRALVRL